MTRDPFNLARFLEAQTQDYTKALAEIRSGTKRSHWMWYVFPQLQGLGSSATSRHYAIRSAQEAQAYLDHPILGPRLLECARAVLANRAGSAEDIFGSTDAVKLRSSATLFASVSAPDSLFQQLIDRYFGGEPDELTLQLLRA
jgi:uncharacterized protein (DUF1810 family)